MEKGFTTALSPGIQAADSRERAYPNASDSKMVMRCHSTRWQYRIFLVSKPEAAFSGSRDPYTVEDGLRMSPTKMRAVTKDCAPLYWSQSGD